MSDNSRRSADAEALARYRAAARGKTGPAARRRAPGRPSAAPSGGGRDPRLLGEVWQQLTDGRGWSDELAIWSLANRWADIVGPQVAEHVAVVAFEPTPDDPAGATGGALTLQADSNAWQQQMIWNLPHLQRRLDAELGDGTVGRIVILGPAQRPRRYGRRRA